jgi:hypothetical protein
MASVIGEGVTYVSSKPVATPFGQGRESTYAFAGRQPAEDLDAARHAARIDAPQIGAAETVTFSLTHEASGTATLHIPVPEPNWLGTIGTLNANGQLGMIKTCSPARACCWPSNRRPAREDQQPVRRRSARDAAGASTSTRS